MKIRHEKKMYKWKCHSALWNAESIIKTQFYEAFMLLLLHFHIKIEAFKNKTYKE